LEGGFSVETARLSFIYDVPDSNFDNVLMKEKFWSLSDNVLMKEKFWSLSVFFNSGDRQWLPESWLQCTEMHCHSPPALHHSGPSGGGV
jgi:hypothetical protein